MYVRLLDRLDFKVPKDMGKDETNLEERKVLTNTIPRTKAERLDSVDFVSAELFVPHPS